MSKTVLVLEDEVLVALDVEYTLEEAGFNLDGPYATVARALDRLEQALPDCAVLDVQLQDGEVYPAARRLRDAGVPIVFHSGHADGPFLTREFPQAVVCAKPSSPAELLAAVAISLKHRQNCRT